MTTSGKQPGRPSETTRNVVRWLIREVAVLFVVRTALEDGTLQDELDGYKDYARRVRYRLLPGVW